MAFQNLKDTGRCFFMTQLAHFDREHPGMYLAKIRNVELVFVGITSAGSIAGSLRNVGVSRFRRADGSLILRHYPSDVMLLSQYDLRRDALTFRFNPNDLRLFENNGIETMWQLTLPLGANDFDFQEILDAQLVLYYDGFFSPTLEQQIQANLPISGEASRAYSLRLSAPDELFYLKNSGEAEIHFDAASFPYNQTAMTRRAITLRLSGAAATVNGLTLRLTSSTHGAELVVKTDASGIANSAVGQALHALEGEALLDSWKVAITAADNPNLTSNGVLDLSGLGDLLIFFEYTFNYR
jgi:hypothetical protein